MSFSVLRVAALLFCSGMCALTYQTTWLRELRLIFGASTPASAAVLAIFMGGLGLGGVLLGRRAEEHRRPLLLYAQLELLIALSAAATPAFLWLARRLYVGLGGTVVLGLGGGTVVRLVLAALVLCVPTVLMGGTLPAAARAVETEDDPRRRNLAVLYGLNTLGAVTGAALSTFVLLEALGNHRTLWLLCAVNVLVALWARSIARRMPEVPVLPAAVPAESVSAPQAPAAPVGFVLVSAAVVGMAFLLMELVFYRMLAPLLGGSSFTFGLILAVALLGIGLGGVAYALWGTGRPATLSGFAQSCVLEALLLALPFFLGDRIALWALSLRSSGLVTSLGFYGHVLGWTQVTMLVVLPAAFVSGVQFPLLIALLGRGREQVGRQVGLAYAWNTGGSIVGSLAGGFGLMPLLSAQGTWRLATLVLIGLGVLAALLSLRTARSPSSSAFPFGVAAVAALLLCARGPTAVWRHTGIGVGRAGLTDLSPNGILDWSHGRLRSIYWERDGIESGVAQLRNDSLAFVVNGKVDGSAIGDAHTQVMSGLLGAFLHGAPRSALVIGLGTGSTAGWLGVIPGMERVDAVEIEPHILQVARDDAPVNQHVMDNPRVHTTIGDGREILLSTRQRYDIIFSEPSNPYRAGIASLYTQEYYQSAVARLAPGGLFVQWLQAYEVDDTTVRSIYATLTSVFPVVETWMTTDGDMLVVGAQQPIRYDVQALRRRAQEEPYRSAMLKVWRVTNLEGVLAHFVGRTELARFMAASRPPLNTDDLTPVEFGFARSIGQLALFEGTRLMELTHLRGEDRPELTGGEVDWDLVGRQRVAQFTAAERHAPSLSYFSHEQAARAALQRSYVDDEPHLASAARQALGGAPADLVELSLQADLLADLGDESALGLIERLSGLQPTEAEAIKARWHLRRGQVQKAAAQLEAAFQHYRSDPWPSRLVMKRALHLVLEIVPRDPAVAERMYQALNQPFSVYNLEEERLVTQTAAADTLGIKAHCVEVIGRLEPEIPWQRQFLLWRLNCYRLTNHPLAERAKRDLVAFLAQEPPSPTVPAR